MKPKSKVDMATVMRVTDPARDKRNREEALAGLQRPTPPMFFERAGEEASEEVRVSAQSPWAENGASATIDPDALPSAMMRAAPAEETPVTKAARQAVGRQWPGTWIVVLSCVGFMLAVGMMAVVVMLGKAKEHAGTSAPTSVGVPSVTAVPSAEPSGTSTLPTVTTAPSAAAEADAGVAPSPARTSPRTLPIHPPTIPRPVATDILP